MKVLRNVYDVTARCKEFMVGRSQRTRFGERRARAAPAYGADLRAMRVARLIYDPSTPVSRR
ncbi:hypothetical protein C6P92_18875 [Burkholderia multivorans]|jgi:hypothetical protein|uniref:Uncharacterized protein n=1 Tax=Burkholderia multivorans TaxID=87883 RepID=A0A8E2RUN1_9BURK|nr:hypothetical protein C6P76_05820 [Burkholderia multivorans]PRE13421.1 hypothetical protein C6P92_18875 [Burkholderia multivorans]PRE30958.1 hypothetical protein C6P79_05810 [Burkholderia multivorans]PRF22384.1 hypothetical protein C6P98_15825 [Burkholderia multivorans]PRG29831.1 hypothetical protein C6T62_23270 [Burkholderia multivorans]